jgi:hypothetical protein
MAGNIIPEKEAVDEILNTIFVLMPDKMNAKLSER